MRPPAGPPAAARPLVGEPLSLDLCNTLWRDGEGPRDLLADLDGTRAWLDERPELDGVPRSDGTRRGLLAARAALLAHLDVPSPDSAGRLDAVLAHGRLVLRLDGAGPSTRPEVADPDRLAAWLCAADYLRLLDRHPGRLRRCAHPDCVLHFLDTTGRGTRRWCSMAGCGNRAKAARHYARRRSPGVGGR